MAKLDNQEVINICNGEVKNKTFEEMNKKERISFIFKLHNGSIIEKELNENLSNDYFFNPSFQEELEFINGSNEVLKIDRFGNVLESPVDLKPTMRYFIKNRLSNTANMIEEVF